jgi:hypothetical protein
MADRATGAYLVSACLLAIGMTAGAAAEKVPPSPPKPALRGHVLFEDDFSNDLRRWKSDKAGVWSIRDHMLRAHLPDKKQQHGFIYAGDPTWADYALDFDVCAMRGVDKGAAIRVEKESGIGVDMRGPGYQDILLNRREFQMGKATVKNLNGEWHHVRVEARGHRYRVLVDGVLKLDRVDSHRSYPRGRIALAAYTGGVARCTVYYDNVVVTALE